MKILLIKPKPALKTIIKLRPIIFLEPLELGYLAAAAPEGSVVRVLDLRLARRAHRAFVKALKIQQPDIVGLSGYTHEVAEVRELAKLARQYAPQAKIIVGGHHATVLPGDFNISSVDAIVRGEGCAPFRAIIEATAAGRDYTSIARVLTPGENYDSAAADEIPVYPELDTVPAPRRDLWNPSLYRCIWPSEAHPAWQTIFPQVSLVRSSFGCRMKCSFCVVPRLSGRRHLTRPVASIVEEIAALPNEHVYFCDDETFLNENHARELAEALESAGVKKRYFAWARTTTVKRSPELFELWRRVGLDAVFLGFEAVTDEALKDIDKRASVADNERAHAALREMGIAVQIGFMVNAGFTADDFAQLDAYVRALPPAQVTFTVFTPSPGSPSWHDEHEQYVCDPFALHDCMHPLTPTKLPLREFYRRFAALSTSGSGCNPLRASNARFPFREIPRIIMAVSTYARALRRAWRDYPQHLW